MPMDTQTTTTPTPSRRLLIATIANAVACGAVLAGGAIAGMAAPFPRGACIASTMGDAP